MIYYVKKVQLFFFPAHFVANTYGDRSRHGGGRNRTMFFIVLKGINLGNGVNNCSLKNKPVLCHKVVMVGWVQNPSFFGLNFDQ